MIHFELLRERNVLRITPDGPLEQADFERISNIVDPLIASNKKLAGILIQARSFPGWASFGAFLSHLKFVADHHRQVERIAVVTDSGFLKGASRFADHFVHPDIRQFAFGQEERALTWLGSGR